MGYQTSFARIMLPLFPVICSLNSCLITEELLKKQCQSESLKCRLSKALLYYRCTPHSVKKIAPSVFLNKRKYVTSRNRINPNYHHASGPRPTSSSKIPQFELGDTVHALNVREGKKMVQRYGDSKKSHPRRQ